MLTVEIFIDFDKEFLSVARLRLCKAYVALIELFDDPGVQPVFVILHDP